MSAIAFVLLIVFMLATLGVLATGVFSMMKGGEFNRKYANQLMRARVLCQFLALLFFALFMLTAGG
ncbi:MAG: twin transmembrane helix small protein [Kiloniellales bacterium]